jgi:hypothetical protein
MAVPTASPPNTPAAIGHPPPHARAFVVPTVAIARARAAIIEAFIKLFI